jgi:hypothetical protein
MATRRSDWLGTPALRVVLKVVLYYAVLIALLWWAWRVLPRSGVAEYSFETLFETAPPSGVTAQAQTQRVPGTLAVTALVAMLGAILLSIPVAWMYQLTRAKRGYQQSVVQLLIVLPIVVAGIVVLVRYSLALAFSLAGIVAAVRFRNTLEDSKDAVYVFLAIAVGLAAAVDVPVAVALSMVFNFAVLVLWYADFGMSPVELEGRIAERRLQRAREMARTGTFVAQLDAEVMRNMTREQLEGLAQRAWRRARDQEPNGDGVAPAESRLRVRTRDAARTRQALEPRLSELTKQWRLALVPDTADGDSVLEYVVVLRKKATPDELVALVRAACAAEVVDAEMS